MQCLFSGSLSIISDNKKMCCSIEFSVHVSAFCKLLIYIFFKYKHIESLTPSVVDHNKIMVPNNTQILTFGITTLSIMGLFETVSMNENAVMLSSCFNAILRDAFITVMLSVVMLSVVHNNGK